MSDWSSEVLLFRSPEGRHLLAKPVRPPRPRHPLYPAGNVGTDPAPARHHLRPRAVRPARGRAAGGREGLRHPDPPLCLPRPEECSGGRLRPSQEPRHVDDRMSFFSVYILSFLLFLFFSLIFYK